MSGNPFFVLSYKDLSIDLERAVLASARSGEPKFLGAIGKIKIWHPGFLSIDLELPDFGDKLPEPLCLAKDKEFLPLML